VSAPAFNHVSVTCADLDRSLHFYHQLVGLPILDSGEVASPDHTTIIGLGEVRLRFAELALGDNAFLELFEYVEPRGVPAPSRTCDPGNTHFAVTVGDIRATYGTLTEAGVATRSAPVTLSRGAWRGAHVFYALDPDGVTVEFIEFPERNGA
jgi:catechol 2,3-dioxygenase-like lactoylglutathione lyase family enzyme